MKKSFHNTARILIESRTKSRITQSELGYFIYGNTKYGQVISNIERGKQGLPVKHIARASEVLCVPAEDLHKAIIDDFAFNTASRINY